MQGLGLAPLVGGAPSGQSAPCGPWPLPREHVVPSCPVARWVQLVLQVRVAQGDLPSCPLHKVPRSTSGVPCSTTHGLTP